MKKILFILNPIAGTKLRKVNKNQVQALFGHHTEITIEETQYAGHGFELAKQAVEDGTIDTVVIAGGDGSINEVASALVGTDVVLGIIPTGSGNGLALHLGIPIKPQKALEVIAAGNQIAIDTGVTENEKLGINYFFSNCGIGYDAEVIHSYDAVEGRGFLTYMKFLFQSMFTLKPKTITVKMENFDETLAPFVFTIANSSQYGYNIEVAPKASIQDGLLDALLMREANMFRVAKFAFLSYAKLEDQISSVAEFFQSKSIQIQFEEETKIQIDGEPFVADGLLNVSILEQSLKVIVPQEY